MEKRRALNPARFVFGVEKRRALNSARFVFGVEKIRALNPTKIYTHAFKDCVFVSEQKQISLF